jgi:hypothetical protein
MLILFGGADREATHFNDLWVQGKAPAIITPIIAYFYHYHTLYMPESVKGGWRQVECSGDVPMPRSGHSADAYGPYVFVFGGMNAAKGAVFNDLYVLDTGRHLHCVWFGRANYIIHASWLAAASWRWYYVGEAGAEISARNSHSSAVLRVPGRDSASGLIIKFSYEYMLMLVALCGLTPYCLAH